MNARMLVAFSLFLLALLTRYEAFAQTDSEGRQPPRAAAKIEGHWTLTIRDELGPGVSVHSFDNHFVGHESLAKLLLGAVKGRAWALALQIVDSSGGFVQCLSPLPGPSVSCYVTEEGFQFGPGVPSLRVEGDDNSLVLSGTVQSAGDGTLRLVYSPLTVCVDPARPDVGCDFSPMTERAFFSRLTPPPADAIVVRARQRINVRLTITVR